MLNQDLDHGWYALHTRHQHEKTAAKILESKGYEVFLPSYAARHKWQDRIKDVDLPLFPGYLFVKEELGRWLQILMTPGVCTVVGCGGRPIPIPPPEIESVRRLIESKLRVEPHPFMKLGEWVRVRFGALAGLEGILIRKNKLARLVLSVEMLGQSAATEVDAACVERINGPNTANLDKLRLKSASMQMNGSPRGAARASDHGSGMLQTSLGS